MALVTRFQLASTPLTRTDTGVPAVWAVGEPVLPESEPGDAVSPGMSNCILAKGPALTEQGELMLSWLGLFTSVAVMVWLPAALNKTPLKVAVPATREAFAGKPALRSEALR